MQSDQSGLQALHRYVSSGLYPHGAASCRCATPPPWRDGAATRVNLGSRGKTCDQEGSIAEQLSVVRGREVIKRGELIKRHEVIRWRVVSTWYAARPPCPPC